MRTGVRQATPFDVVQPGISPAALITCVGVTNVFVATNAPGYGPVSWSPSGALSGNARMNRVMFASGGSFTVTATYGGCSAQATVTAVAVDTLTADSTHLCRNGTVIYTATTTPPGYENYLSWGGEAAAGGGAKRTNSYSTPGPHLVSVSCGTSAKLFTNIVYAVNVIPSTQTLLADATTPAAYSLTNSYGLANWSVSPSGPSISGSPGTSVTIGPGSEGGNFAVIATSVGLSSCLGTAALQVVQVRFSANALNICEGSSGLVTMRVTPASYLGQITFDTVTNQTTGGTNTHASVSVDGTGTNLTVSGTIAGTVWLRARLGSSIYLGPAIKIARVNFSTNDWYVKSGGSSIFGITVLPSDASITCTSANPAIATVSVSGTNVTVTGVSPGTTQIFAQAGTNQPCAVKEVTVVSVKFSTNSMVLCNGNSLSLTASIQPPATPVTFSTENPSIVTLGIAGTNLTVTALAVGTTLVTAKVGGTILDSLVVWSITVTFPTNSVFAPQGGSVTIMPSVVPQLLASKIDFATTDPSIATVSAAGLPPRLTITALTNGTTQITAKAGTNQLCASKSVTTFTFGGLRFQKAAMVGAWKDIDAIYKFLGVFTGQSVTFGVVITPSHITLPGDLIIWSGAASGSGAQTTVNFSSAGSPRVIATVGGRSKSVQVEVIDRPSGVGENAYAASRAAYTLVATARNLIGLNSGTLEPFVWASTNFPTLNQHNTIADAARHAYWTCLLTRYTVADYAEGISTQHEVSVPGPSTETVMDLHNNAIGISIAYHAHGSDNACCQAAVISALNSGLLWYLDGSYGATDTPEATLLQPTNR